MLKESISKCIISIAFMLLISSASNASENFTLEALIINSNEIEENSGAGQVIAEVINGPEGALYFLRDNTQYPAWMLSDFDPSIPIPDVIPDTQHVYISESSLSEDGSQVSFNLTYLADDPTTTGVGFSLNFDSSVLSVSEVSNVFAASISSGQQYADSNDTDSDASTDQLLNFFWASLFGGWPGSNSAHLATITFDITGNAIGPGYGALNIVKSSGSAGFDFIGHTDITEGVFSHLSIDRSTGEVTLDINPNFENVPSYDFDIIANNGSEASVTTHILDSLNFTSPTTLEVGENIGPNQVIYTAQAGTYADGDVVYSLSQENTIEQGPLSQRFVRNADGTLTVQFFVDASVSAIFSDGLEMVEFTFNYETEQAGILSIASIDYPSNPLIKISNSEDYGQVNFAMVFASLNASSSSSYDANGNLAIAEVTFNAGDHDTMSTFTVSDVGLAEVGGTVAYPGGQSVSSAIFSPNANSSVTINQNTGEVTLLDNPVYENQPSYSFWVTATDDAGSTTQYVTANILDIYDHPLVSSSDSVSIDENIDLSQIIYTATSDLANTTFSLSDDSTDFFSIDSNTGAVSILESPDYENETSFTFTVIPELMGIEGIHKTVTVSVNNLDEISPTITSGDIATSIDEHSGAWQTIYTTTSDDTNDISLGVTFSLSGEDGDLFAIDSVSGEVTLTEDPDYEIKPLYSFVVVADDGVNTPAAKVVLLEINQVIGPIEFTSPTTIEVAENIGPNQVIYTAQAETQTDGDVVYSLSQENAIYQQQGAIKQTFIDNNDGTYTMELAIESSVAEELENVELRVVFNATEIDILGYSLISSAAIAMENAQSNYINFVAIFYPESLDISNDTVFLTLDFTTKPLVAFANFDITEVHINDNYGMAPSSATFSPNAYSSVTINQNTGEVTLLDNPVYENQASYSFWVTATDDAGSTTQYVTVSANVFSLDIDQNGVVDALTDGLIILKYAFEVRNETLLTQSIALDSPLSYNEVLYNLDNMSHMLDVDDDGKLTALSDGLLILRYLFGLRDEALTNGIVNEAGARNTYAEIVNYLDAYSR